MSPVEWWEPDGEADPDTLQACLTDLVKSQQSVRELRERRLMAILNVKGTYMMIIILQICCIVLLGKIRQSI